MTEDLRFRVTWEYLGLRPATERRAFIIELHRLADSLAAELRSAGRHPAGRLDRQRERR